MIFIGTRFCKLLQMPKQSVKSSIADDDRLIDYQCPFLPIGSLRPSTPLGGCLPHTAHTLCCFFTPAHAFSSRHIFSSRHRDKARNPARIGAQAPSGNFLPNHPRMTCCTTRHCWWRVNTDSDVRNITRLPCHIPWRRRGEEELYLRSETRVVQRGALISPRGSFPSSPSPPSPPPPLSLPLALISAHDSQRSCEQQAWPNDETGGRGWWPSA